ncbi:Unknown protein [Striga hermonthica]|uniref:Myb/SANT-like domain-containing protein n=1 Tax=Striga hermonthica TaxID=68872 RepID=A0A9N7N4M6_STRHE|nr:Unknown protein [Striga hermonthica]
MDMGGGARQKVRKQRADRGRRSWSRQEEEVLIGALKGIVTTGWKADNGFRMGFLNVLEQELRKQMPETDLQGVPHINSKIHVWKKDYASLCTMLARSGIGWNESTMTIETTDDTWADYVKVTNFWPYYYDWIHIFGKDRATGEQAEDILDAVSNVNIGNPDISHTPETQPTDDFGLDQDENVPETLSENIPPFSSGGKKSSGRKRKSIESADPLCDVMRSFSENTSARLCEIAKRIGYEYDVSQARKDVFVVVRGIEGLNLQEQLFISKILVKNTDELDLFFSLDEGAKAEFVRMKLTGTF